MRLKVLALIAGLALVTACESAPGEGAAASGAGAATSSTSSKVLAPAPGTQNDLVVNVGDRVFFDFDRYNLKPSARRTLEKQAAWLKKYSKLTITVQGHTDERGTREYNLALGARRANSAKDYLISLGVNPNRLKTISYGKERPVALGSNEAAWAQNRRAVTVVN
ncbi:MAG TPA: peptidoglycan-associated lipoprotein Pal [Alphaproteobacteria bacterium]|nr:peptidoglycan-associated lipoprotein Pal [Alphaproteobacteria bacterium]